MSPSAVSVDIAEQVASALDLATEAHFEAGRLLGAVRVLMCRLEDPQEAVESMNSDEVDEMTNAKDVQGPVDVDATAPVDAAVPVPDDSPLPDGVSRISASRLREITGWSPSEFRTLASMSDDEFEKARQVGFGPYLRAPAEAPKVLEAAE